MELITPTFNLKTIESMRINYSLSSVLRTLTSVLRTLFNFSLYLIDVVNLILIFLVIWCLKVTQHFNTHKIQMCFLTDNN